MRLPRLRGAIQVVVFNWPKVLGGTLLAVGGALTWRRLPWPLRLVVAGATAWTPGSLLASWWVYDLSPLRRWRFVEDGLPRTPERVLLVIAGFDEVSPVLRRRWPAAHLDVVDVVTAPEASVRRARRWYPASAPVVAPRDLGSAAGAGAAYDVVLFAQSAHEIREPGERQALFAAARDALRPDGRVVLVEHLRDLPNLVAFGPGALHFTSRATWLQAFADAGLQVEGHRTVTPLVHCYTLVRR